MDANNHAELTARVSTALEYHQQGQLEAALEIYLELGEHIRMPMLSYNIGLIYLEQDLWDKALIHFESAHELDPNDADFLFSLALCQKNCGEVDKAVLNYQQLIAEWPDHIDGRYNLACCYKDLHRNQEAIDEYLEVLRLQPAHLSALNNLAYMYQLTGDKKQAIGTYEQLLQYDPERESAKHMLSALLGQTEDAPPESYVRDLFDSYAEDFEESLVENLEYSVPSQLRSLVDSTLPKSRFSLAVDLGCGTGLGGEAFNEIVETLDGVDLSENMISIAEEKKIYRSLSADNILSFLSTDCAQYDFFLAVDVLTYLGDLNEIFSAVRLTSKQGAVFAFSVETSSEEKYQLLPSGRFAHSEKYIRQILTKNGFDILAGEYTKLRREGDSWIKGTLWVARLAEEN